MECLHTSFTLLTTPAKRSRTAKPLNLTENLIAIMYTCIMNSFMDRKQKSTWYENSLVFAYGSIQYSILR